MIDALRFFRLRIAQKAFRGELGLGADEGMIHHEQRLRSHCADITAAGHQAGIGKVEHFKKFRQTATKHGHVDTAAWCLELKTDILFKIRGEVAPPISKFKAPLTDNIVSRIASASSLR